MLLHRVSTLTLLKILFIIISCCIFMYDRLGSVPLSFNSLKDTKLLCHYEDDGNVLPVTSDGFNPRNNSIFFHETSCKGDLDSRQACVIESAARLHPNRTVHVLFSGSVTESSLKRSPLADLLKFSNIFMIKLNVTDYVKSKGLIHILESTKDFSPYKIHHTSDVLRLVTLYKYGGIYLDTDTLVVRSLDALGEDWAAGEEPGMVNDAAICVAREGIGHDVIHQVIEELKSTYKPELFSYNGPLAVTRVFSDVCRFSNTVRTKTGFICEGFKIYDRRFFYPYYYTNAYLYFRKGSIDIKDEFTHHLWNRITYKYKVQRGSPFDTLAERYCPTMYNIYGHQFNV